MTPEERFERIEHITAGIAEERRKDRDEYKALWRDTQKQLNETARALATLSRDVSALATETRMRIRDLADEARAADRDLQGHLRELGEATDARIAALTSAVGEHLRKGH